MEKFEINERIMQLIEYLGISNNGFAKEIGISSSRMSAISTHRNKPDSEMLALILNKYSFVSGNWLVAGIGEMKMEPDNLIIPGSTQVKNDTSVDIYYLLEKKDQKIIELAEEVGRLKGEIESNKKIIAGPTVYNKVAEP